jgi:protein TonB
VSLRWTLDPVCLMALKKEHMEKFSLATRTLLLALVLAILGSSLAVAGFAQQVPATSDSSPSGATSVEGSPCRANHEADKVVRVEGKVTQGLLVHKVNPSYPRAARSAGIEGTVVLCAAISKDGKIDNLTVAAGPPELISSSIKAVKKWRYKPYLLNGEPVEVYTEIRVNYALSE